MPQDIEYHNFQLASLDIRELSIVSIADNVNEKKESQSDIEGSFQTGKSEYNEADGSIIAGLKFEINPEKDKSVAPFSLSVEIRGVFHIKEDEIEDNIDANQIDSWIEVNSIYLLFPYLREQVYSLTQRAGFEPVILPLLSVPGTSKSEKATSE